MQFVFISLPPFLSWGSGLILCAVSKSLWTLCCCVLRPTAPAPFPPWSWTFFTPVLTLVFSLFYPLYLNSIHRVFTPDFNLIFLFTVSQVRVRRAGEKRVPGLRQRQRCPRGAQAGLRWWADGWCSSKEVSSMSGSECMPQIYRQSMNLLFNSTFSLFDNWIYVCAVRKSC